MSKKLSLSTETLRVLTDEDLADVKGAAKTGKTPTHCRRNKNKKATRFKGCNNRR